MYKQNTTCYSNTNENKQLIIEELQSRYNDIQIKGSINLNTKNLIYFSVFGEEYVKLFNLCILSLIKTTNNFNFDILVITDDDTQKLLLNNKFNIKFLKTSKPNDGIEASMKKLLIYEFCDVKNYKNILFLDSDIIIINDINEILDASLNEKIEVTEGFISKNNLNDGTIDNSFFYGLNFDAQPSFGFNAGQFLFKNTEKNLLNFKNIEWLTSVWPGQFFYEQSFMNYYFNKFNLLSFNKLNKKISYPFILQGKNFIPPSEKRHKDSDIILHFAGTPSNGNLKNSYIEQYIKMHNLCL